MTTGTTDDDEDTTFEEEYDEEVTDESRLEAQKAKMQNLFHGISNETVPLRVHDVLIKGNKKIEAEIEGLKNTNSVQELLQAASIGVVNEGSGGTKVVTNKPNPFGGARPREEVLSERGLDWMKIDMEFEAKLSSRPSSSSSFSSSSFSRSGSIVSLPPSIRKCYDEAVSASIDRPWGPSNRREKDTIRDRIAHGKKTASFAHSSFIYAVNFLGSVDLENKGSFKNSIVEELYEQGLTISQHGVFSNDPLKSQYPIPEYEDLVEVAIDLTKLFNSDPLLRMRVRQLWVEHKSNGKPHSGNQFEHTFIGTECSFLIYEYYKHGPGLGLTVREYVEFCIALYDHCHPVSSLGAINEKENYSVIPSQLYPKRKSSNMLTTSTLSSKLLSPLRGAEEPIPNLVICICNSSDFCVLNEIRYNFEWENGNLVNKIPKSLRTRLDWCMRTDVEHDLHYLTGKDRIDLLKIIESNPSYGFFKPPSRLVQNVPPSGRDFVDMNPPPLNQGKGSDSVDDDGFTKVCKGKAKKR